MKINELIPVYCDEVPSEKEEGKLYISKKYQTAIHLCACGCKGLTVTPLKSTEWTLDDSNGKATLRPSIGNFSWEHPNYHAHYFITDNKIQWV